MPPDNRIGTEVGSYRIEALIGRGGMGIVYLAEHVRLESKVALKILSDELSDDRRFRERFEREARLAAKLRHPSVVSVHDAGEVDGLMYIAMDYIEGPDLRATLDREHSLEPPVALSILDQVADALDMAHINGLIHRDVKPENILLDRPAKHGTRTRVYLTDFGIAKRIDARTQFTSTGVALGTANYMAPELLRGEDPDGRADQYSLACVLYECLAGEPPFDKPSFAALITAHLMEPVPAITEKATDLPDAMSRVIQRGMSKQPLERYDSCTAFVEEARAVTNSGVVRTIHETIDARGDWSRPDLSKVASATAIDAGASLPAQPRVPEGSRTAVSHFGEEFKLGYDIGFIRSRYIISDMTTGKVMKSFPMTPDGWRAAWESFLSYEPDFERGG